MAERGLPLDDERYQEYLARLRELVEWDPDLTNEHALHAFFREHRPWFGSRTAGVMSDASDDQLRIMIHVMVLASSELGDLHEDSRIWLSDRQHPLPPWDVSVPRTPQRLITFVDKVYGAVEWEPERGVELDPKLSERERKWATALAVGIGERPQWTYSEVWRYAAYLVTGSEEFAWERERSNEDLAEKYGVPVEAVRYRRQLPDAL